MKELLKKQKVGKLACWLFAIAHPLEFYTAMYLDCTEEVVNVRWCCSMDERIAGNGVRENWTKDHSVTNGTGVPRAETTARNIFEKRRITVHPLQHNNNSEALFPKQTSPNHRKEHIPLESNNGTSNRWKRNSYQPWTTSENSKRWTHHSKGGENAGRRMFGHSRIFRKKAWAICVHSQWRSCRRTV